MPAVIDQLAEPSHVANSRPERSSPVQRAAPVISRPLWPERRLFTVQEYDLMLACGVLREGERSELLNGTVNRLMTRGPKHSATTNRAGRLFERAFGDQVAIRKEDPIILDDYSEPEPDLVLARPDKREYAERHPTVGDILLVIEVADSSLSYDRDEKGLAYARAGLTQFLLFNVSNRTIVDYREPSGDGYRHQHTFAAGQNFSLVAFPERSFPVSEFLPE